MQHRSSFVAGSFLLLSVLLGGIAASAATSGHDPHPRPSVLTSYGKLPLSFIANQGQVDEKVLYYLRGREGSIYFTRQGIVYDLLATRSSCPKKALPGNKVPLPQELSHLSFTLKAVGARENAMPRAGGPVPGKVNYLIGNNPSQWQKDIPLYREIVYEGIYEKIDLNVYGTDSQMEYDFVVHPGGNPKKIRMAFEGIRGLRVDWAGNLVIDTALAPLIHLKPVVYQEIKGNKVFIDGAYQVADNSFTFALNKHDPAYPLIIDPLTLSYSTYLGGVGTDFSYAIAIDGAGSAYITGYTYSGRFPTQNAFQANYAGEDEYSDVFITKLDASGTALSYSTYLGGTGDDVGIAIAVDSSGNAYVTGYTVSSGFPTQSAYQASLGGGTSYADAFVAKLDSSGSALVYSTYLGGNNIDYGCDIALDPSGSAYVAGTTTSGGFPTQNAYQAAYKGSCDTFLAKLDSSGTTLSFSTFLGGSDYDYGCAVAVDASGSAYVAGTTASTDFPTQNAYQTTCGGSYDSYLAKFDPSGASLLYSTYLGGTSYDSGTYGCIALDASGNAYLAGCTYSSDFPTQDPYQGSLSGTIDSFVAKFNASGETLSYSTYLGGNNEDYGCGIAVAPWGNIYVTGYTFSSDFPTQNAFQGSLGGTASYADAFITKLDPTGTILVYSSYLGGNRTEYGMGIAVDTAGNTFITGFSNSTDFPVQNAYQADRKDAAGDAFVAKLNYPSATLGEKLYFPHIASNGTWETEIAVINTSSNATVTGILRPYGNSGNEVSSPLSVYLPPLGRNEITIATWFGNPAEIGYIILESDSDTVVAYTKFWQDAIYRVAIPAVKEINTDNLYVTHIASNQIWWTGLSLLNTNPQATTVTLEFDNATSTLVSLAANEHTRFTIEQLLGGQPQTDIHSAVIRNGSGVIGVELFGNTPNQTARCLSGILLTDDTTTILYYPHVASGSTWWTGIVAYNPAASAASLTINPYSAPGTTLSTATVNVDEGAKYLGTASGLNLPAETAWLRINANSAVTGFELMGTTDFNQLAECGTLSSGSRQGVLPKLEKQGSTQVALVNIEATPATLTLNAYDNTGTQVGTTQIGLSAYQKLFEEAQDFFPQDISTATYLAYSADRNVVAYQLNASVDKTMLDGLPGL